MDPPKSRPRRKAGEKARKEVNNIYKTGTKRPREPSTGPTQKARKRRADRTPPPGPEDPNAPFKKTPSKPRMPGHSGVIENDGVVYVGDIEQQILAEARGVTRKDIPCDVFHSTYLSHFEHPERRPKLDIDAIKRVGTGDWEQKSFFRRLCQALPSKVRRGLKLHSSFSKTLHGSERGKEPLSQPDFVFHVGGKSPTWAEVELLFKHTQSSIEKITEKFLQWLRGAWNVFYHQPFRRHLYGILFLKPYALICYADHGCAGYSEPLDFMKNPQHTQFLMDFLADFIAEPEHRGRDPTVTVDPKEGRTFIQHAGLKWAEVSEGLLCYRPSLVGRNIRVARVELIDSPENEWVMKNAWEEKLQRPSPPPEEKILRILDEANVRGLPQLHELYRSTVEGDGNVEVETHEFPENCENALAALNGKSMKKIQALFISGHTSKSMPSSAPTGVAGEQLLGRFQLQRRHFNECIEVRRRLTRVILSYCQPLRQVMRNTGPKELMRTIRDAMIVYYEAYKRPEHSFLHGDISIENIMVPVEGTKLTGGLTYERRRGTLINWNLCFTADGMASDRSFRSGTPAFVAPILLEDKPIARRTLGHDMESFFTVMLWIASLNYEDKTAFRAKPLVNLVIEKKPTSDIVNAKMRWFRLPVDFKESITDHFEEAYRQDHRFIGCVWALRRILYEKKDDTEALVTAGIEPMMLQETSDDDPMKERVFGACMAVLDNYLGDEGRQSGSYQLEKINAGKDPEESEDGSDDETTSSEVHHA